MGAGPAGRRDDCAKRGRVEIGRDNEHAVVRDISKGKLEVGGIDRQTSRFSIGRGRSGRVVGVRDRIVLEELLAKSRPVGTRRSAGDRGRGRCRTARLTEHGDVADARSRE